MDWPPACHPDHAHGTAPAAEGCLAVFGRQCTLSPLSLPPPYLAVVEDTYTAAMQALHNDRAFVPQRDAIAVSPVALLPCGALLLTDVSVVAFLALTLALNKK